MNLILTTKSSRDYELLDSGLGEKLERYGKYVLRRPDPQALWRPRLDPKIWDKADAVFERSGRDAGWKIRAGVPERWEAEIGGLKFLIRPTAFKHTGVFPEQAGNWEWMRHVIQSPAYRQAGASARPPRLPSRHVGQEGSKKVGKKVTVLNLFGYTGGASLACAQAGAEVCHVDGSKTAIGWARDNAELNSLGEKPTRWILEDAVKFVEREIKRGHKYDGVIMDPPAFGHGPGGEMWLIEKNFLYLMDLCEKILSDKPLFVLVNGYASGYSAIAYENNLLNLKKQYGGEIEKGELTIAESGKDGRLLPCGIFARWSSVK